MIFDIPLIVDSIPKMLMGIGLTLQLLFLSGALGLALVSLGKLDDAIQHHREALRENPKLANAHNNLGSALSRLTVCFIHGEAAWTSPMFSQNALVMA